MTVDEIPDEVISRFAWLGTLPRDERGLRAMFGARKEFYRRAKARSLAAPATSPELVRRETTIPSVEEGAA